MRPLLGSPLPARLPNCGSAYIFRLSRGSWEREARLIPWKPSRGAHFGQAVQVPCTGFGLCPQDCARGFREAVRAAVQGGHPPGRGVLRGGSCPRIEATPSPPVPPRVNDWSLKFFVTARGSVLRLTVGSKICLEGYGQELTRTSRRHSSKRIGNLWRNVLNIYIYLAVPIAGGDSSSVCIMRISARLAGRRRTRASCFAARSLRNGRESSRGGLLARGTAVRRPRPIRVARRAPFPLPPRPSLLETR